MTARPAAGDSTDSDPTEPAPTADQLRDLIRENQRLTEKVRRVEAWAAMNDDMAREYDEAAASVTDSALIYGAQERAEDCRAVAEGVRRALDGSQS